MLAKTWTSSSEPPWRSPHKWDLATLPEKDIEQALEFLLKPPTGWSRIGEADEYTEYLEKILKEIRKFAAVAPASARELIDGAVLKHLDIGLGLFGSGNVRNLARARALLLQDVLRRTYPDLPLELPAKPERHFGKRRLGIVIRYFKPFIDNFMLAGFLTGLREKYEITLYSVQDIEGRIDAEDDEIRDFRTKFLTLIDRYVPLDKLSLPDTVKAIRRDRQDMLLFGNTMQISTAKAHLLHAYRFAPVQIATTITTSSTGFDNVDYYVSAACTEPANAEVHYHEKLLLMPGFFYALAVDPLPALAKKIEAAEISPDAPVLISGAAWPKLTHETLAVWMEILQRAPEAQLVLYPNSPSWCGGEFAGAQARYLDDCLRSSGIDPRRCRIADPRGPEEILPLVARAMLYLDAFPYSGNMSLREPLLMGCPVVTRVTPHQRGMQGAAMLRALGIGELVAENDSDYRDNVLDLLKDQDAMQSLRARLGKAMPRAPFYNTAEMGKSFAKILDSVGKSS